MELSTNINKSVVERLKAWRNSPLQFVNDCIKATPTEQQIELLQAFPKGKRFTVRSGHGCHAKGTIIHMYPYGFKSVEDIEVGDQLMGDDNSPRNVLNLIRGREQMYRVRYHDKTYYDVNESHILSIICTGNKCEFKTGDKLNISVKDYLAMLDKRPSLKGRFAGYKVGIDYPEVPVMIPPYILGLWLGDGTHTRLELTNTDRKLIGIWQLFGERNGLRMSEVSEKSYRLVGDADCAVLNAFKYYNLIGNKHIPKEYLFNSKAVRLKLLAGLLDTDGYADTRNTLIFQIIQKRESLAEDILFLAQSCGMHAILTEKRKTWEYGGEKKCDIYYEVSISRNTQQIPTQLKHKQDAGNHSIQRPNLHFGFKIEKLSVDNYYGFELDKNHLYVLGDFTVTHNTGKDAVASWLALNFLVTRPFAKVVVTAPTNRQLKDVFLSEIAKWLRQSIVADEFLVRRDSILHKEAPKEWWLRLISPSVTSTKEEQAETLAGLHGDHLFIIVDESSGVPDPVFVPLEGAITQPDNKTLLIGNMTKGSGVFYDTHFNNSIKNDWIRFHWDSRKSSNVDKSMPDYFAAKYGVESNIFRIRVEGNPPLQDENTLIPLYAAEQCIGNEFEVAEDEPLYLGVDVARYGDDASIILPRRGLKIFPWETFRKLNTIDLGGFINQTYQELEASGCAIDVIGVGAGVADWLEKRNMKNLYQVNVANSSSDITKYNKLRDELWVRVRDNCLLGKYSFPAVKAHGEKESLGQQLANELSTVRYKFNSHGGYVVESKKDMKARGIASPNIADALCLTEYFHNSSTRVFAKEKPELYSRRRYANSGISSTSWLGV
jgi:hypothetical protein